MLRESVLRYSREIAFAAAQVYAQAAESRGAWDARLEALVVDALLRGEVDEPVRSRASALGWGQRGHVAVVVGLARDAAPGRRRRGRAARGPRDRARRDQRGARRPARRRVDGVREPDAVKPARHFAAQFAPGPVVVGPVVARPRRGRPVGRGGRRRAAGRGRLAGGPTAGGGRAAAARAGAGRRPAGPGAPGRRRATGPLADAGGDLLDTLTAYLEASGSIEGAARALFVHPNTVRYRLRRVAGRHRLRPRPSRAGRSRCGWRSPRPPRRTARSCRNPLICWPPTWSASIPPGHPGVRKRGPVLAIVAPGQGAQVPGFLAPWLELPQVRHSAGWLSASPAWTWPLRHRGRRGDDPGHRGRAAADRGRRPVPAAGAVPAPGRRVPAWSASAPVTRSARSPPRPPRTSSRPSRRWSSSASAAGRWPRPRPSPPTGMTAVLGGDRDDVLAKLAEHGLTAANDNGAGQIVAAGTLEQLAALQPTRPRAPGSARWRSPARSTPSTWRPPSRRSAGSPRAVSTHDPRTRLLSNARRCRRARRPRGPRPPRRPGQQPGPLGPVHADDGRPRRHRPARAAAGRHARPAWPSAPSPASRSSRSRHRTTSTPPATSSRRTAARTRSTTPPPGACSSRPAKGTFRAVGAGRPARRRPRRSAWSSPCATSSRCLAPHGGTWSSGSSRTATPSPRASRWSGSTPRRCPHDRREPSPSRPARRTHARILGVGGYRPGAGRHQRRDRRAHRLLRRVDPRAHRHRHPALRRRRRDRRRHGRRRRRARRSPTPASPPTSSAASSSPPSRTCRRPRPPPPTSRTGSARRTPRRSTSRPRAPASATALALANDMVRAGSAEHVLVVGVEKLTDILDPYDRGTAFIFGDGAGAVVVGRPTSPGIGPVVWGADGARPTPSRRREPWHDPQGRPRAQVPDAAR